MNTSEIKKFATAARRLLLQGVRDKLLTLGFNEHGQVTLAQLPVLAYNDTNFNGRIIPGKSFYYQWTALQHAINEKGISNICEEAAYTWFNRLVAIRILQKQDKNLIRNVLDFVDDSRTPAIVHDARHGIINGVSDAIRDELDRLLLDDTKTTEQFSILISAFCEDTPLLNKIFGRINDYTELLLPNDILNAGGFIDLLNNSEYITDDDYLQTELIGWLYQFYISEKKDEVFAKKGKFAADEIPAATQIFTPNWIVKYMVQNTLGRIYLDKHPEASFKGDLKYLVEPADGEHPKYEFNSLEELLCGDLACGSGHILVELFDLLYRMYEEEWYDSAAAIENIFTKNLIGVDLDTRAKQLTMFALILKACQKDPSFADAHILPQILDMPSPDDSICQYYPVLKQAKTLGSIMKIEKHADAPTHPLVDALTSQYAVLVMNPPYMGSGNMNTVLSNYVKKYYEEGKADLFSTFMLLAIDRLASNGKYGMINMHAWMFLSSFETLRNSLLTKYHIDSLLHLGTRTFDELSGEVVQNAAFVVCKTNKQKTNNVGVYYRLVDGKNCADKERMFLDGQTNHTAKVYFPNIEQKRFEKIPGCVIGYWATDSFINIFGERKIDEVGISDGQNITGDNNKYLKLFWEVSKNKFGKGGKWVPVAKGGSFRRWYGNIVDVIDWSEEARDEYRRNPVGRIQDEYLWYREGITWNLISSGGTGFRFLPNNCLFNKAAPTIVIKKEKIDQIPYILAFLNTKVVVEILKILNPTYNTNIAEVFSLPLKEENQNAISTISKENVAISKADWDSHETSWNFKTNPIIDLRNKLDKNDTKISVLENEFKTYWENQFEILHNNEEELNCQFINIYGLENELTPAIPYDEVTILQQGEVSFFKNHIVWNDDVLIKQLISYAMGCWMGRYRLDKPGLHIAHSNPSAEELSPYEAYGNTFEIDDDGIVPLMDEESPFADNAVSRMKDFVSMVFGTEHLTENLNYIRECLGMTLEKYFQTGFWKDHLARYQKRPIYWLFQSNKKNPAFQVLVYMHRMDAYSCEKVRTYLLSYIDYLKQRINQLEQNEGTLSPAETRKLIKMKDNLKECLSYEERLHHVANQQIAFDLDDGVKVNYAKFGDVLAAIS